MTISAVIPDIAFAGSGGAGTMGPFSLVKSGTPLVFFNNSEVVVLRYSSVTDQTPALLVEGTHYTLTGGPSSGVITLISPSSGLTTNQRLYVTTLSSLAQGLDLVNGGNFSSANLERRLDIIYQILQQHAREIRSTVRFAMFDTDELPKTLPLNAAIGKIPYVAGTAASPTLELLDVDSLGGAGTSLTEQQLEDLSVVAADLTGADTIGIVAADLAGDNDIGEVADWLAGGGGVGSGGGANTCANYAALTAIEAADRTDNMLVFVASRTTEGDGGEGWWRFDAAASTTADAGTVLAPDAGTGRWSRIREPGLINVRWFGAVGDGTTNDTTAVQAANAAIATTGDFPGAVFYFPRGRYRIAASITVPDYVTIKGDGRVTTILDFTSLVSGSALIFPSLSFLNGIQELTIQNTPAIAIDISGGTHVRLENLYIRWIGTDAVYIDDASYMVNMENLFIVDCGGYGVNVEGFATSVYGQNVFTSETTLSGFRLNDLIYSSFDNCAADTSDEYGWEISNVTSVVFTACSGEANTKALFRFAASNTLAANVIGGTGGRYGYVKGVVLNGCFALSCATVAGTSMPSFIECSSLNSRNIDIKMIHCRDIVDPDFQVGGVDVYASPSDVPTLSISANGETRIIDDGSELDEDVNLSGNAICWRQNSRAVPHYGQQFLGTNFDTYINDILVQRTGTAATSFRGSTVGSAFFNLLGTTNSAGAVGLAIKNSDTNSSSRDWGLYTGNYNRGDFVIMQSSVAQGNPISGSPGLILNASRQLGIGTATPVASGTFNGAIAILDGMTAPSTQLGWAQIYVDTDGDLKVKFGDGVVKTLATDT